MKHDHLHRILFDNIAKTLKRNVLMWAVSRSKNGGSKCIYGYACCTCLLLEQTIFLYDTKIVSDGIVYVDEKIKNVVWSRTGVIKPVAVWTSLLALRGRHHRITAIPSPGRVCSAGPNAVVLSL